MTTPWCWRLLRRRFRLRLLPPYLGSAGLLLRAGQTTTSVLPGRAGCCSERRRSCRGVPRRARPGGPTAAPPAGTTAGPLWLRARRQEGGKRSPGGGALARALRRTAALLWCFPSAEWWWSRVPPPPLPPLVTRVGRAALPLALFQQKRDPCKVVSVRGAGKRDG